MIKNNILFVFVLFLLVSCEREFDTESEIIDFISDDTNGYHFTKTVNNITYDLQYKPTDLIVKQYLVDSDNSAVLELRKKYGQYMYFNLSMSKYNKELLTGLAADRLKFGATVNDLAFGMEDKIHLITSSNDTIRMMDYIYPRMYGMTNSTSMLLVYQRDKIESNSPFISFIIEDLGFETGDVTFKIDSRDLQNEPRLRF